MMLRLDALPVQERAAGFPPTAPTDEDGADELLALSPGAAAAAEPR